MSTKHSLRHFTARLATVAVIAGAGILTTVAPASAHVSLQMYGEKPYAGKGGVVFARIGHAEPGLATVKVEIQIPDGVTAVKPQHIAGWTESSTLSADGTKVTSVLWSGGNLPDSSFQDFGIKLTLPNAIGQTLYFKTVQTLSDGSTLAWIEIPVAGTTEPAHPAPKIVLLDPALDPLAGAATSAAAAKIAADAATVAATAATTAARDAQDAVATVSRWTGEITATLSMTSKKVRIVADTSTTNSGKRYIIRTVNTDGSRTTVTSGRLDSRGDLTTSVAMQGKSTNAYHLMTGTEIELLVAGKVLATGKAV